ncbi:MAG: glycosyltransferase family 2 protein [Lachnospiraceae bacterium]|nr:glycosyltransferase family 2 protein [Lachnospiraceae bacterium]
MKEDNRDLPRLAIIIPCYNEEKVLPETAPMFLDELKLMIDKKKISADSRILFVNDGSKDNTWPIIKALSKQDEHFEGIAQSRNRGHQNALVAGMMESRDRVDAIVTIDCDGQDDITAMEKMVDAFRDGNEIVYGVRSSRDTDTWFKRNSAQAYYKLLNRMGGDVVYNHADYRLVSNRVLNCFADYHEVNLFLRGIFPLIGFKSTTVAYERHERMAGESHYPLSKMLGLAFDGITSLSVKPLQLIAKLGGVFSVIGLIGIIVVIVRHFMGIAMADGWASLACIILFIGGIQLISLGVLGEYIGKIYLETKHRPRYIISERTWEE